MESCFSGRYFLLVMLAAYLCNVHTAGGVKYHIRNSYHNDLYVEDDHHDVNKKPYMPPGKTKYEHKIVEEPKKAVIIITDSTEGKEIVDAKKKYIDKEKITEVNKEKNYVVYSEKPTYKTSEPATEPTMKTTAAPTKPTMPIIPTKPLTITMPPTEAPRYFATNKCQVTFSIPMEQYEHICPTWEVASLKKQLVDIKFWQRNSTQRESYLKKHLARETMLRHRLQKQVTLLRQHVINMQSAVERLTTQINSSTEDEEMDDADGDNITQIVNATDIDFDCSEVSGYQVYTIQPVCFPRPVTVLCDNGWTVFMRRLNGSVDFFRDWLAYKDGFGDPESEFWLGLDALHALTTQLSYRLVIEMTDWQDTRYYAEYNKFWTKGESQIYRIHIGNYTGNLRNSLYRSKSAFNHDGQPFSTFDKDNDNSPANCASFFHGAHWYNDCYSSNLFGRYCSAEENTPQCMVWWGHKSRIVLKTIVMKVKRVY